MLQKDEISLENKNIFMAGSVWPMFRLAAEAPGGHLMNSANCFRSGIFSCLKALIPHLGGLTGLAGTPCSSDSTDSIYSTRLPLIAVLLLSLHLSCSGPTNFDTNQTGQSGSDSSEDSRKKPKRIKTPEEKIENDGDDNAVEKIDLGDKEIVGSEKWKTRYWLNFSGAQVNEEESFIVANVGLTSLQIPPFDPRDINSTKTSEEVEGLILRELRKLFAGIQVEFVGQKPEDGQPYSIAYIGGENFTEKEGILGRAPLDFDNFNPDDRLFVFPKELAHKIEGEALTILIYTLAHEIAHSLGLRHIDNEAAIMNPTIFLSSNDFDETGAFMDGSGEENSQETLIKNLGSTDQNNDTSSLPVIESLAAKSQGNIGQYSIFDFRNIDRNPGHRLGDYDYSWKLGSNEPVSGPSIRVAFNKRRLKIKLQVSNGEDSQEYEFELENKNYR